MVKMAILPCRRLHRAHRQSKFEIMDGMCVRLSATKLPNFASEIVGHEQNGHFPKLKREKGEKGKYRVLGFSTLEHQLLMHLLQS